MPQATYPSLCPFSGTQGLLGCRSGVGFGHAARAQRPAGGGFAREPGHRPANAGTLANVVVEGVCSKPILESGPSSVHALALRRNFALVIVPSLRNQLPGPPSGSAQI